MLQEQVIQLRANIYKDVVGKSKYKAILCEISNYTPILTLIYIYILIGTRTKSFEIFWIGYFVNVLINYILKTLIRSKRPIINKYMFQNMERHNIRHIKNYDIYGMPSMSMQLLGYVLVYVLLVTKEVKNLIVIIIQIAIVIYNGILFRHATTKQIIVGLSIGGMIGTYFGKYREMKALQETNEKKDDECKVKE